MAGNEEHMSRNRWNINSYQRCSNINIKTVTGDDLGWPTVEGDALVYGTHQ